MKSSIHYASGKQTDKVVSSNKPPDAVITPTFVRSDGAIGKDKTRMLHSRPGRKEAARAANRRIKKQARAIFKRQDAKALEDE